MRKRRESSETLILNNSKENEAHEEEEGKGGGFFACYLLCSLCPRFKGHTYIGFTNNPRRRIRQHNGELRSGAWRTKSKRPWEMMLCIYGFPTNVMALQFEWAWQHPTVSLAVRKAAVTLKSLSGIESKIKLAYTMLTLPPWQSLNLTVNFFSTKYMKNAAGCKSLPKQMKVQYCPMDELPCYTGSDQIFDEMDEESDEDEVTETGINHRPLGGLTDISASSTSDYNHSRAEVVHDIEKWNENDIVRQSGDPCTLVVDESNEPLTGMSENQQKETSNLRGRDHGLPFGVVDSPLITSSKITNLVNTVETLEDRDPCWLNEMSINKFGLATKLQVATPVAVKQQISLANALLSSPEFGSIQSNELSTRIEEGHRVLFSLVDTPMKMPFAGDCELVNALQDEDPNGLIEESRDRENLSRKQCPETSSSADTNQLPSAKSHSASPKIEVIDISTPSSDCMIHSFRRKKRRNNWISQEIIDLTKSPSFVQL